eukprot:TRINITY_DN4156_c0_g2_i1.p1 TRINITY_DN4156_c0_g2~~TRINITY_DN4156_c0_g2_i1.p1  ORF type:complete len:107 (+),score=5.53 TRINITY_DN4156_c0_g2_i1:43-321(+)
MSHMHTKNHVIPIPSPSTVNPDSTSLFVITTFFCIFFSRTNDNRRKHRQQFAGLSLVFPLSCAHEMCMSHVHLHLFRFLTKWRNTALEKPND